MIDSLRVRLTAWYIAFFAVLFAAFGLFLYQMVSRALEARLDRTLEAEASTAANLFLDEMEELNGDVPKAALEAVSEMRLGGATAAVFAGSREVAASGPAPVAEFGAAAASAADSVLPMPGFGRHGARAAVRRVSARGVWYAIVAAEPLDSIVASLEVLRRVLLFGFPVLMIVAGAGGYLLSTRSLAPLNWMAEQAHSISGSSLHKRLEIGEASRELKVLADSFNELLSRLDQTFESMRRFVADASHELRTPLAVIRGEADVALGRERPAAEYRASLAVILDESRRLSRLVDDLLNLARADAGQVRLRVAELYLNEVVAECCRALEPLAAARRVRLESSAAEDVPFRGDEVLLRRLVANLLDNAIRYTPEGGRVAASVENGGPEVRIRVADTGVGIGAEFVPHIFERFYRADQARSRESGGFGLGLAIVKWIAESHRGAVEVETRPGEGSEFTVKLPRETAAPISG